MEPIISPLWFYFTGLFDSIAGICLFILIFGGIATAINNARKEPSVDFLQKHFHMIFSSILRKKLKMLLLKLVKNAFWKSI